MYEFLSGLAVRHLKREHVTVLRKRYFAVRAKLDPLTKAVYGTFDAESLCRHLEERIGKNYEILMVHCSVNHMKPMYTATPLDLVRMLIDFCSPERTLVMPAFYFGDSAIGGAYATFKQQPCFDLRRTPSQMGLATELFRRGKGVVQSRHPVYRVAAFGPLAEALACGHERADRPCGRGTPFDFMANHETQIIGIGKPVEVLTQVHHAEDLLGDDFPVPCKVSSSLSMKLIDGGDEIPFELPGRGFEWRRNMWKLRKIMNKDSLKEWKFHHVPMFATRANDVTSTLINAAKHGVTIYDEP